MSFAKPDPKLFIVERPLPHAAIRGVDAPAADTRESSSVSRRRHRAEALPQGRQLVGQILRRVQRAEVGAGPVPQEAELFKARANAEKAREERDRLRRRVEKYGHATVNGEFKGK